MYIKLLSTFLKNDRASLFHYSFQYEKRRAIKRAKLQEALVSSWCKTAWFLQQVFSVCNPNAQGSSNTLYFLGLECILAWLKIGPLPLETTSQIYPHLVVAASHYAPNR